MCGNMTKTFEFPYEALNLTELKSNIEEQNIIGYSINYTVGGLLFFGGFKIDVQENNGVICNDAYLINLKKDKADYEILKGKIKPTSRCYHNACTLLENYVIIFGGLNSEVPFIALNDLWLFNSVNKTFFEIKYNDMEKHEEGCAENCTEECKENGELCDNEEIDNMDCYGIRDEEEIHNDDDSILDNTYIKNLKKYLRQNNRNSSVKNGDLNASAITNINSGPTPRYFSSLDLYISRKSNADTQGKEEEKDELYIKNNKIVVNNAENYECFSLIVFGGYGGYDRSSFNDLYEYNILSNKWILRSCKGIIPSNRYGHISFINGNNLFILGGTNAEISFNDMYTCNLKKNEWTEVDFSYSYNASKIFCRTTLVESIDKNIIFIFGGYNIISDDKGNRKIEYSSAELNMLKLYDTFKMEELKYNVVKAEKIHNGTSKNVVWQNGNSDPYFQGDEKKGDACENVIPSNITFSCITYDFMDSNIVISDTKKNIYVMNISRIIGPKYAIFNLWPKYCDIEGNKKILLKGKGFTNEGKIIIRYKSDNVDLFSEGIYINENNIYTVVPNAKNKIKNNVCNVQLSINDKCYTTNSCILEYYYNIDPKNVLIFGTGLLEPICLTEPNIFFLIAKNCLNENKQIGGDKFQIKITYEHNGQKHILKHLVYDLNNGFYIVKYFPLHDGKEISLGEVLNGEEEVMGTPVCGELELDSPSAAEEAHKGGSQSMSSGGGSDDPVKGEITSGGISSGEITTGDTPGKIGSKTERGRNSKDGEENFHPVGTLHIEVKLKEENIRNSPFVLKVYNQKREKTTYVKKFVNDRLEDLIKKAERILDLIKNKNMNTNSLIELNISIENFLQKFSKSIYDINIVEQYILHGIMNLCEMEKIIEELHKRDNVTDAQMEDESCIDMEISDLINAEREKKRQLHGRSAEQSGEKGDKEVAILNSVHHEGEGNKSEKKTERAEDVIPPDDHHKSEEPSHFLKVKNNEEIVKFINENKLQCMDYVDSNLMKKLKICITLLNGEEMQLKSRKDAKWVDGIEGKASVKGSIIPDGEGCGNYGETLYEEYLTQNDENKTEAIRNLLIFYYKLRSVCICKKEKELRDEFVKEEKESIKKLKLNYSKFVTIKKNLELSTVYTHSSGYETSLKELEVTKKYLLDIKEEVKEVKKISDNIIHIENVEDLDKDIENINYEICEIEKLWIFIKKKEEILNSFFFCPFKDLDVEEFDVQIKKMQNDFKKIKVDRKYNICKEETLKLKEMTKFISVLGELKKVFVKERHIKEIEDNINEEKEKMKEDKIQILIDDNTLTIYFYKLNVMKYHDTIEEVVIKAYNEKLIEETINKFDDYWNHIYFKNKDYKNGIVLTYIDDMCIDTIEEHQVTLQNCFSSKYFVFFSTELNLWQNKISNIYEVMQLMKDIEKLWVYLQNMYIYSEEVKKELPLYSKFFLTINDEYLDIMKRINDNNIKVINFSNENGIINKLEQLKEKLCKSEKPLNEYLDSKRKSFPRFFFISSTDLIDILSNGNNFKLVNTHVQKIFLSIRRFVTKHETLSEQEAQNEVRPLSMVNQVGNETDKTSISADHMGNEIDKTERTEDQTDSSNGNTEERITRLISSHGEEVCAFHEELVLKGKVECYLNDIIRHIKHTLKYYITHIFQLKYLYNEEKEKWIDENYLAQVFILCNTIFFVNDVESILCKTDTNTIEELKVYYKNHIRQLENVIKKVQKKLTTKNRIKIMCIITLDTFYRDILEVILKNKNGISVNMFDWQSQIRMYPFFKSKNYNKNELTKNSYKNNEGDSNLLGEIEKRESSTQEGYRKNDEIYKKDSSTEQFKELNVKIRIMDCSFNYSYDYIGNYQRLVITPLTSRIYITATQALSLYMGCAPAGPAGTGKTETTKDLSSFFGKNCYVFNCSDQLDYKSMGNIFKGIGSTGCWCCFDEFNRLIPEVLSVCSIQFKSILDCKRNNNNVCIIGSDEIIVKKNCAVFITMNPDYLGRSKLPESLKILFRPITVIVPDFNKICENMLMAEGYVEAKHLSIKFTTFFELAQSLLKEKHCDWGLRSIKSVLTKAGFLKRTHPNVDENELLYSAIHDINIAKISSSNCPIFSGLLNDIFFPNGGETDRKHGDNVTLEKHDNDVALERHSDEAPLEKHGIDAVPGRKDISRDVVDKVDRENDAEKELMEICKENHLFGLSYFVKKVLQLNDIMSIRHCVFIMGEAGCGKTTLFNMLMEYQKRKNLKTVSIRINPKSISIDDLYGNVHIKTREWKDGVFSKYMRNYSNRDDCDKAYIIFDGNLDSHWIENMNSVMDDNKVLTLSSNERIILKSYMNLVFEFSDLMFATPATISRAGLVYFSVNPNDIWKNYFLSWIEKHDNFPSSIKKLFEKLMYKYVEPTFTYLNTLQTSIKISPMSHIQSLSSLLDVLLKGNNFESVEHYFIYAVIWCFGSFLGEKDNVNYKKCFDKFWKNNFKSIKVNRKISVFDFYVENNKFKEWEENEIDTTIDQSCILQNDIFIETVESTSYKYISKLFLQSDMPILFIGKTGVGKTQLCKKILSEKKDEYKSFYIIFNYYTTSKNIQALMQSCLEKKSGKQFSPPYQQKLIYFIDDINMPKCDDYNTQSAIELLCQYIDTHSWFDLEKLNLIQIINTKLISCMNYNRGNFTINPRLIRHFFLLNINFPENNTVNNIFSTLLKNHFSNFKQDVADLVPSIMKSTISLYYNIEKTFKRTATYFYYEFNLRDIHSIVKGLLTTTPGIFQDCDKLLFLWLHECERVYSDKLNRRDKKKYKNIIIDIVKKMYNKFEINKFVMKNDTSLLFTNFHKGSHDKCYDLCKDMEQLTSFLTEELEEYNNFYNLNIVLFNDAIKHICKLIRIVDNIKSHALLLGIGGCGKTTISKFSSYLSSKVFFEMDFSAQCTDNDVKKYIQNIFYKCAIKNEDIILFLRESKIHDSFFVYVNEYMCSNNIIDLYTKEERDYVIQNFRNMAKSEGIEDNDSSIFDYYIRKVNTNLHFVLCFSPTSNNFRDKSNNFQCILNYTMIDIYENWESDSLMCVGRKYVSNLYMNVNTGDIILEGEAAAVSMVETVRTEGEIEAKEAAEATSHGKSLSDVGLPRADEYVNLKGVVIEYLKECYEDLLDIASYYYTQERSHIYVTPKLFLESIKTYHIMLQKNITNISNKMDMLKNGITKMNETSANVENIKNCLKEKKKVSEEKKAAAEKYAIDIGNEKMIVKKESDLADIEEKNCLEIQKAVLKQQEECENDIALGIPLIEQAEEALNTLNKKNIQELKTLNKPPPGVEDITAAVMQLLATIDTTICVDKFGKIKDRSWKSAQKMMINPEKFISLLKNYKNKIDENVVPDCNFKYVENLINLPHFNKNAIQKKSKAAAGLAEWVLNITSFYKIIQNILPKRTLLDNTKKGLEEANEKLQIVREKVQSLKTQLGALIDQYDHAIYERDLVILEEKKLKTKLELSIRLIDALSSEQISWSKQYETLKKKKKTILTDILLSSTFVTFCGGFTKKYRNQIMARCIETLNRKNELQNVVFAKAATRAAKEATLNTATANATTIQEVANTSSPDGRDPGGEDVVCDVFSSGSFSLDLLINEEALSKLSKQGLTLNSVCIENNIILENSEKFPIIIDPQMESLKWLINNQKEKSKKLIITDINDQMFLKKIEESISFGYSVIIENADEYIDNTLYNIISKNIIKRKNNYYININDKELIFHPSFYIILHTQLSNPHYQPEIQSACSLINFTVTPDDLEEHLLSITLENEFNHLSKKKKKLSLLKYDYICQLSFLQSSILQKLTNAKGDILEDVSLIENLEKTKLLSENIAKKSEVVKNTEVHINTIINLYRPLCKRGVMYFFILQKLKNLHSFYFYSLEIFLKIYIKCLNDCSGEKTSISGFPPKRKTHKSGKKNYPIGDYSTSEFTKNNGCNVETDKEGQGPNGNDGQEAVLEIIEEAQPSDAQAEGEAVEEKAVEEEAVEEEAVEEKAVEEKAVEEEAVEGKAMKEKAVEEIAVEEIAVEEIAVEEKAVEEIAVEEIAVEEKAVEEKAVEEIAVEEELVEEEVVEEEAVKEIAVEEKVVEEKAVEEEVMEEEAVKETVESKEEPEPKVTDVAGVDDVVEDCQSDYQSDYQSDDLKDEEIRIDKNEVEKRVGMLINLLIVKIWMYIDKGLLERDKLIVKCLIMLNLEKLNDKISQEEEEIFINPKYNLNTSKNKMKNGQKEKENMEKKIMNKSFISEELYEDCKNLENLKDFEKLTESFENDSMSWKQWFLSEKVENEELPRKYNSLKDFSKLLLIRVLRKDRFLIALKNYIKKNIKMANNEVNSYSLENILEEYIDNKTPVLFLLTPGNDPSKDIEAYIGKLRKCDQGGKGGQDDTDNNKVAYVNISMGQGQESIALKYLQEISKSGGYIFLQNIHLMTKWLKEFEEILDKIFLNAHIHFRLFLSSTIPNEKDTKLLPEKLLKKCFRVNNEKSFSLKDNVQYCLDKFEDKKYDKKTKTIIFGLSYYHSLLLSRFLYGKIGFSQSYSFNDNDLEISFNIITRYLSCNKSFPLADVIFLIGEIIYGGHITDLWDRRINKTYVKNILKEIYRHVIIINGGDEIEGNEKSGENGGSGGSARSRDDNGEGDLEEKMLSKDTQSNILFEMFKFPDCGKYTISQLKRYVDEKMKKEQTYLLGLHINAETEYMKNECTRILQNLQEMGSKEVTSPDNYKNKRGKRGEESAKRTQGSEHGQGATNEGAAATRQGSDCDEGEDDKHPESSKGTKIIYDIINHLLSELPEKINITDLKIEDIKTSTFMVIALKEAEKFNILIECISDTLMEIKLVLDGILNMNNKIQSTIKSLLLHNIPDIWKNYAYPSKKKLMPWFENFKLRIEFIKEWVLKIRSNYFLPNSVWLSALFNPISFLTAIKQKFSHENKVPIDQLRLKWKVTNITKVEDLNNKNNSLYIHGLFLQGASWVINSKNDTFLVDKDNLDDNISYGNIVESVPKNTYFPMPLVYVYCVTNEQEEQMNRNAESRSLNTPLYVTSDRGSTFVCSIDLNLEVDDIEDKWILAGVALFLSDD
ncbi:dynein heavy chain, putative [Plasmodium ovale]|uniref:Dynein heavy chain, putative n=1 Tax=Plasmodium ovale TaxID=36330 RepID=A0A1D3THZ9_PLAOA|nr:dynein heavy chain, putative [Plasmodium ovale]